MTHEPESDPTGLLAVPMTVWLELFYDLVFVAAILVLSDAASHVHDATRILRVIAIFVALWWVWLSTTLFTNRFRTSDITHRLLVLGQMFVVVLVAMEAHAGVKHDATYLSLTYAALVASVAVMYTRAARTSPHRSDDARRRAGWPGSARACSWSPPSLPWPVCVCGVGRRSRGPDRVDARGHTRPEAAPDIDEPHLVERMGAFTIIVCGEAFVKVAIAVSGSSVLEVDVVALFFEFVLTFAIWTSYFEDVPQAGIRAGPARAVVRVASPVAARDRRHRDRRGEAREGRTPRPSAVGGHPRDHRRRSPRCTWRSRSSAACTRRRPDRRPVHASPGDGGSRRGVGIGAWQIDFVDLVEGVAALSVVAVIYTVLSYRMTRTTSVRAAR